MNISIFRRAGLISLIGATLLGSASCVDINEELGENLIPLNQLWDVYIPEAEVLDNIELRTPDSLSAYSSRRITFGAVRDELGLSVKGSSFTLVPILKDIYLGENTEILQFHFSAVRDTLSTVNDDQQRMMQNVFVYSLREPLSSDILYINSLSPGVKPEDATETNEKKFIDRTRFISQGIPVYNGSDSLSFDFSKEFAEEVIDGITKFREGYIAKQDTLLSDYLKLVPGIYLETETPSGYGGRINMFDLALEFDSNSYISGNFAELKVRADYGDRKDVDTSFLFIFGPSDFIKTGSVEIPTQYAFNGSTNTQSGENLDGITATDKIYVEGGGGVKPVIKAKGIKALLEKMIKAEEEKAGISINPNEIVINKASIVLPYDVKGDWDKLNKYPTILSPTVRLHGKDKDETYVSYAGLTDSSIESENQGDINRSLSLYAPDISHHVQEILKLKPTEGESEEEFNKRVDGYDIWMLIMHEEVTVTTSAGNSNNDYYNSLLYNSYYNNMMYDPYGYGYGYGYGGYGYGGYGDYGYGYGNYYNYMMMASYMNSGSSTSETISVDLDRDRYYDCILGGPTAEESIRPKLKITFSAPKAGE